MRAGPGGTLVAKGVLGVDFLMGGVVIKIQRRGKAHGQNIALHRIIITITEHSYTIDTNGNPHTTAQRLAALYNCQSTVSLTCSVIAGVLGKLQWRLNAGEAKHEV